MKRGFTMIELIFVIVILGILAAVALPKMAATRDDAKVSAVATEVGNAIQSVTAYYTATGKIDWENAFTWNPNRWVKSSGTDTITYEINTSNNSNSEKVSIKLDTTGDVNMTIITTGTTMKKLVPDQNITLKASSVTY